MEGKKCRNLNRKETLDLFWGGSLYESYYFGVIGPGFLNQVPTLRRNVPALTIRIALFGGILYYKNQGALRECYSQLFRPPQ